MFIMVRTFDLAWFHSPIPDNRDKVCKYFLRKCCVCSERKPFGKQALCEPPLSFGIPGSGALIFSGTTQYEAQVLGTHFAAIKLKLNFQQLLQYLYKLGHQIIE